MIPVWVDGQKLCPAGFIFTTWFELRKYNLTFEIFFPKLDRVYVYHSPLIVRELSSVRILKPISFSLSKGRFHIG